MISVGVLLLSLLASSLAQETLNDWEKPCLEGVCYYDLPATEESAGAVGTLKIWGSPEAITDITTAAGWEIIDCDPTALSQKIRLVCTGDAKCNHLFGKKGAKGKIVRLPESCGKNAFAHIKAARPSPNKAIPAAIAAKIVRRDGIEPEVQELEIDTDFSAAADEIEETVFFDMLGSNTVAVAEEDVQNELNELEPRWKVDKSHTFPLFSYHKPFVLVDQSLTCSSGSTSINGNLRISGNLDADVTVRVGAYAKGSIIPPKVKEFKAYAVLNGAVSGAIDLSASLSGSYSTGRKKLVEVAIAGINFAGIITIGPTIAVDARVDASFGIAANVRAGFNWQLVQAQLYLPASSSPNGQAFQIGTAPLQLTITPTASATAMVEAHIIPVVALKLKALGLVEAKVYVDLDASAKAVADVSFSASGGVSIPDTIPIYPVKDLPLASPIAVIDTPLTFKPIETPIATAIIKPIEAPIATGIIKPVFLPRGTNAMGSSLDTRADDESIAERATWTYTYGGCLDVDFGLDINFGASASFFGIFNPSKVIDLYTKNWDIYYGCFGDRKASTASRRNLWARSINASDSLHTFERRLTCTTNNNNIAPVTVINTNVSGASAVPK